MATVLADQAILDPLGQRAVDELCHTLTGRLRQTHPAEAISETIAAAAEQLATALPRAEDDVNELPDALVILD